MFLQADSVTPGSTMIADVTIAGAGAAGITLALSLRGSGLNVVVLEIGQFVYEEPTQDLYSGTVSGSPYALEASRLRYFGGATNHWGGWVRPLDEADFAGREWIPNTGWPIAKSELDPYYDHAFVIASQLDDPYSFDWQSWVDGDRMVEPLIDSANFTGAMYRISPVRFNGAYRPVLEDAQDVTVLLGANVTNIATNREASTVTGFEVRTLGGNAFTVNADRYVIALGGIDNSRLLLASRDSNPVGLGNSADLVGRYFMDHSQARSSSSRTNPASKSPNRRSPCVQKSSRACWARSNDPSHTHTPWTSVLSPNPILPCSPRSATPTRPLRSWRWPYACLTSSDPAPSDYGAQFAGVVNWGIGC